MQYDDILASIDQDLDTPSSAAQLEEGSLVLPPIRRLAQLTVAADETMGVALRSRRSSVGLSAICLLSAVAAGLSLALEGTIHHYVTGALFGFVGLSAAMAWMALRQSRRAEDAHEEFLSLTRAEIDRSRPLLEDPSLRTEQRELLQEVIDITEQHLEAALDA